MLTISVISIYPDIALIPVHAGVFILSPLSPDRDFSTETVEGDGAPETLSNSQERSHEL